MTDVPRAQHGQQLGKGQQEGGSLREAVQEPLQPQKESLKAHGEAHWPGEQSGEGMQQGQQQGQGQKVSVEEEKVGGVHEKEKGEKGVGGVGGKEESSIRGSAPKGGFESSSERSIDPTHLLREGTGEEPEAHPSTIMQERVQSEHIWQHDEAGATGPAGKQEEGGFPPGYTPPEQSEGYKRRLEEAQKGAHPLP